MSEESPEIIDVITMNIKLIMTALVVLFFIGLFYMTRAELDMKFLERSSYHVSENLYASDFLRPVFSKNTLDELNGKNDEPVHKCEFGAYTEIKDTVTGETWAFGYKPLDIVKIEETRLSSPAVVSNESVPVGYENGHVAVMDVALFDTYTTRLSCMIEKAMLLKEAQSMRLPCIYDSEQTGYDCVIAIEPKTVDNKVNICIHLPYGPKDDCREMLRGVIFAGLVQDFKSVTINDKKVSENILKIYPATAGMDCDDLKISTVDQPSHVKLCLEDLP